MKVLEADLHYTCLFAHFFHSGATLRLDMQNIVPDIPRWGVTGEESEEMKATKARANIDTYKTCGLTQSCS